MDDWQRDFFYIIETVTSEVEKLVTDVAKEVNVFMETLAEISENVSEQVQQAIATEFDDYLTQFVEPLLDIYVELDEEVWEMNYPGVETLEPRHDFHPACVGCRHFHGQSYNGNLLICGMHPYGYEGNHCPDWETH